MKTPLKTSLAIVLSVAVVLFAPADVKALNTIITSQTASGSLASPGNWTPASVPGVTNDAVFDGYGGSGNIKLLTATNLTVGSLNVTTNNGSFAIRDQSASPSTLALGGSGNLGNSVPGANVNDLLYVAVSTNASSLRFYNTNAIPSTGLTVVLGQSGNFNTDTNASIIVGAPITDNGNGYTVTKTGVGTLTFSNSATFQTLNVLNGTVVLNSGSLPTTLKSLLVTNNTLTATNSTFTFTSGTLTTSNAPTAIASYLSIQTNATVSINGTWNMIGGTNVLFNVSQAVRSGQLVVGNTTAGTLLISNATLSCTGPVAGNSNCAVALGASNSTVIVEQGGVLANVGSVLNTIKGNQIGVNGCSFCSLIVTNGGYASFTSDLFVGYGGGSQTNGGVSNSLIVAPNSLIDFGPSGFATNVPLRIGFGNNFSNSTVVVNGGVLTNLNYFAMGESGNPISGFNSSLIVSNGGKAYVSAVGSSCFVGGNFTNASGNSLVIAGSSSLVDMGNQILYVGYYTNAYNNSVIVNGGTLTNVAGFRLGYYKGNGAYNNSLIVTNGGKIYTTSVVSLGANGTNNSVLLAGAGTLLTNGGSLTLGAATNSTGINGTNTFGNSMVISNGATFNAFGTVTVGSCPQPGGQSISNSMIVGGGGAAAVLNVNLHSLYVGDAAGCVGNYLILNTGGVIANGSSVFMVGDAGSLGSKFYFNGGKLVLGTASAMPQTGADGTNFVQAGGAIIDDGGFAATQKMPLLQDPASTGGGLTKLGAGTLTLTNLNTYTGNTVVGAGTLTIQQPTLATASTVIVSNGAVLNLGFAATVTNQIAALVLNGSAASAGVHNATTDPTYLAGTGNLLIPGSTLPSTGTNIVFGVTNNTLTLSWPASYVGWELQSNAVSVVDTNSWFLVPGSTSVSNFSFTVNPSKTNVFYRMHHP